ncbi:MAG TPA: PRC-barrel domain-containing protein [Verrucomicrobiae bacterium]|jgi:sporulation protein YlmC with PRC-barrel domain|nr:PRC-barrel domain-containing protein [Verrucomicrobiae bacterium]
MKKQMILAVSATTLTLFSVSVLADNLNNTNYPNSNYPDANHYSRDTDAAQFHRQRRNGELGKADHLMGMAVKNDAGETIGKVRDLALDLQNGRIVSVIVAAGGVMGVDRKLVAVPPSLFTIDEGNKTLRTSLDKSQLENAPEFKMSDWKNATQASQIRESYQYYGVPTYFGAWSASNEDRINNVNNVNYTSSPVGNGKARDLTGQPNNTADSVNAAANAAAVADNSSTNTGSRADARDYSGAPANNYASNNYTNNAGLGNGKARDVNGNYTTNLPDGNVVNTGSSASVTPYANPSQEGNLKPREAAGMYAQQGTTYYSFPSPTGGTNAYYHSASYYDRQHPQNIGEVVSGRKVIGSTVYDSQNEKVGKVENFVIDLQSGRIVEVVLESGGFLGIHDQYTAVPPQSVRYNTGDSRITMDVTRDSLQSSPHFRDQDWETANQPERINDIYRSYHVEPYFTQDAADNTARNVRDRSGDTLTPADQGNSKSDIQTTAQIRKAVLQIDNLSVDAKNVKIITRDGHVTLRGVVNSDQEKHEVLEAAKRISSTGEVDDQLDVKGTTPISTDSAK